MAARYISTFNLIPNHVNIIAKKLFPKKPDVNTFISKFPFNTDVIPPNTESSAAIIAIAKYPE